MKEITIATSQIMIFDCMHQLIGKCLNGQYGVTASTNDKLFAANIKNPDNSVVFIDIESYGIKTVGIVNQLRKEYPDKRIIVFSMHNVSIDDENRYLYWGADALFSLMEEDEKTIYKNLISCIEDKYCMSKKLSKCIDEYLGTTKKHIPHLTDKEIEVVRAVARGMTKDEISKFLNTKKKTIEIHVTNIYNKLYVRNSVDMLKLAVSLGILPIEEIMINPEIFKKDKVK